MSRDLSHLHALELGLSHERQRLARARTEGERALRTVWVADYEKQIADERAFLGLPADDHSAADMSDDELLAALGVPSKI